MKGRWNESQFELEREETRREKKLTIHVIAAEEKKGGEIVSLKSKKERGRERREIERTSLPCRGR